MNAIPFDTLQFANRLKAVGFSEEQAAVLTELQKTATGNTLEQARHDYHLDDVAAKRDLKELEATLKHEMRELDHKIELLRADTQRMIAESKADLTRWIIGAGFLQTALIIGVLLKIAHLI
ncbi:CCDC90 family protein [Methylomonas rapida]|uniref:CCDC90 family protein n=1 Tax=Methylomonas rapida TaxID=2963939 RepID=A0ABY7GMN0_9GAMM|nr:CCDC90 family protein [Methylomonas rapida]WAR45750.1 CCDC90 family protein [Methylomonas rapida]